MNSTLRYGPAYLGLYASLVLALACNAFLDIQYRTFGFEVTFWAIVFGLTLGLGWRQRGEISSTGRMAQKLALSLGMILTIILFVRLWGFPRAGLAILAMLQAAQNCVTVTRKHLYTGLLVSAVMVIFAASHFRADWTMLFYLLPYVAAAVFTLIAEQIDRRAGEVSRQGLMRTPLHGQAAAIVTATSAILLLSAALYALTPQVTWPELSWKYGQLSGLVEAGVNSAGHADEAGGIGGSQPRSGNTWLSPAEMRQAATRPGMPRWQKRVIEAMADAEEWWSAKLEPLAQRLSRKWQWLSLQWTLHYGELLALLRLAALLILIFALWRRLREKKAGLWLLTRLDYLRYVTLQRHAEEAEGVRQLYAACGRLFALYGTERSSAWCTGEYLRLLHANHGHLSRELAEMTRIFEDVRYGAAPVDIPRLSRMRELYKTAYLVLPALSRT